MVLVRNRNIIGYIYRENIIAIHNLYFVQDNFSLAELIDCFEEVSSIPPNLPINKSAIGICVFSRLIQNAFHLELRMSANVHDFLQETLLYDSEPSITS